MCDEFTVVADGKHLGEKGLNRREFSMFGVGIAGSMAIAGCATAAPADGEGQLAERMVSITMSDGVCDAFFVHPAKGVHPGVLMWPDVGGLREVKKIMARSLAAQGYAVLVVNQYYRNAPAPVFNSLSDVMKNFAAVKPYTDKLTPAAIVSDARAYAAFLDGQEAVDRKRRIGTYGFCMGGPFAVRTAAAVPARVGAACSFHGAALVTAEPDSPHRLLAGTKAAYLFAIARNDDMRSPTDKDELRKAADAAGLSAEIEVYPADHGWCVADAPAYDPNAADKAFKRMLATFATL